MSQTVRIIGAGVAGLVTAYRFAKAGAKVRLYEKAQGIGHETCSWWAGGMLAPYCERESAPEAVVTYANEAFSFWREVAPDYQENGSLVVVQGRDARELDLFARRTRGHELIDQQKLSELEPDVASRFARALYFPQEAHLTPRLALREILNRLQEMGADMHFGVDGFSVPNSGEMVVDCTGMRASKEIDGLRGVRGEMLHLKCAEVSFCRPVRLLHPRIPLYIVPRGEGVFMVGATMIESPAKTQGTVRSVVELLNAAYAFNPAFAEAEILEIGADVRPAFPDNLPKVVETPQGLYINGMYRHGYLLMPALAKAAVEFVMQGKRHESLMQSGLAQPSAHA